MEKPMEAIGKIMERTMVTRKETTVPDPESTQKTLNSQNEERTKALYNNSNVPLRHRNFTKEQSKNAKWNQCYEKISETLSTGCMWVIMGLRGTGKTQMAISLIKANCTKNLRQSVYIKALDIFMDIRASYRKDSDNGEGEVVRKYCVPKLLVIDACENRSDSAFENLLLNHIIDKRYDACLDTVMITNETESDFIKSAGASIISRIQETGGKIVCDWESFRIK
jgi:DNA replication protein DnaC